MFLTRGTYFNNPLTPSFNLQLLEPAKVSSALSLSPLPDDKIVAWNEARETDIRRDVDFSSARVLERSSNPLGLLWDIGGWK